MNDRHQSQYRLAVYWRALDDLPTHGQLLHHLSRNHSLPILHLTTHSHSPVSNEKPVQDGVFPAHVRRVEWIHPVLHRLQQWKSPLNHFKPDLFLGLEEPYSLLAYRFSCWCRRHHIPYVFLSCQNIDRPLPLPFSWLEKKVLQSAGGGWFLNQDAYDRARQRGFKAIGRVIPLGINKVLDTLPPRNPNNPFVVGYAGRLVPEKGIDDLIHACHQAHLPLLIAGEGPEQERLKALARQLSVETEWLGWISPAAMMSTLQRMSVLVLPSHTTPTWKEQFGRILIEAMAAGVPVIGSRSGEIPAVIGHAGWTYPEGDVMVLAQQLAELQRNPLLYSELVQRGLAHARCFTWDQIADQLHSFLLEILENRHAQ